MVLELDTGFGNSIFPHNRRFTEGVTEIEGIRTGAATVVIALDGSGDAEQSHGRCNIGRTRRTRSRTLGVHFP